MLNFIQEFSAARRTPSFFTDIIYKQILKLDLSAQVSTPTSKEHV